MSQSSRLIIGVLYCLVLLNGYAIADDSLTAISLRCEYLQNPLGIDEPQPRLSWRHESNVRGQQQTGVICPWTILQFYGDTRVIEPNLYRKTLSHS